MRRLLIALAGALFTLPALAASVHEAQYGVGQTFNFLLYNTDGTLDTNEADGGAEVSLSCDEGTEGTATNDFVDEGTFYSIALTAAEMECARIAVVVAATDTNVFFIETYGDIRGHIKDRGIASGVAQTSDGGDTTTFQLDADAGATWADDALVGALIVATNGTAAGEICLVSVWASSTDEATCARAMDTDPTNDTEYIVYPTQNSVIEIDANGYASVDVKEWNNVDLDSTNPLPNAAPDAAGGLIVSDAGGLDADAMAASVAAVETDTSTALPDGVAPGANGGLPTVDGSNYVAGIQTGGINAATFAADADAEFLSYIVDDATRIDASQLNNMTDFDALMRTAFAKCEVNTANDPGSTTDVNCILTDLDDMAVTGASGDLEGLELVVLDGAQVIEKRFIGSGTVWDGGNMEINLPLTRALPDVLADGVSAIIR